MSSSTAPGVPGDPHGSLSTAQVEHYWREGYVSGIPVLTIEEVDELVARLQRVEAEQTASRGTWTARDFRPWEHADHPLVDWFDHLARHPKVLDVVASILGPDILIRNADVFIKEPRSNRTVTWHRDTAVVAPETDNALTAWIGLTVSNEENGGLQFSAGSHRRLLSGGPTDPYDLAFSKEMVAQLDPANTRSIVMDPGMVSLHHFCIAHRSGPNRSAGRRIAFAVRYVSTAISAETAASGVATIVRGQDLHRHFSLKPRFPVNWSM